MCVLDYLFIKKFLSETKNIIITTHKTPDGDALGSSLGLFHALKNKHNVSVIVPNEYPHCLKWLPGNSDIIIYEGNELEADKLLDQSDLIFCLDFNKISRVATMMNVLKSNKSYKIMIDHHQDPDDFCNQVLSNSSIASTAELIHDFLFNLDLKLTNRYIFCQF